MPTDAPKTDKRLAKGQRTRERLLGEALRLFAERGYAGVGIRDVAAAAETNIAAIAFHFSGKEGLYGAVIESVAGELAGLHRAAIAAATAQSDALGEDAGQRIGRAVAGLVTALLTSHRSQWMSLLLQREFITPTAFFVGLYDAAIRPTLEALETLVGRTNADGRQTLDDKALAFLLFITTSSFQRNRNTFLAFIGQSDYTPDDIATISRVVADFAMRGASRNA